MPPFILIALATLLTEDLTCVAVGVLVAQGRIGFLTGTLACMAGICFGDLLLFLAGRIAGRPLVERAWFQRLVPRAQMERASSWLRSKGAAVIFLSRFLPGLRLPTYFAAGVLRTSAWRFSFYFLLASAVWTPLLVGGTALFGEKALGGGKSSLMIALVAAPWASKRLAASLGKLRWEFWPPWAAYLPVLPYILWQGFMHRSLTLFTAANPGIFSGGFRGESKFRILERLARVEGAVPSFTLIPADLEYSARLRTAREFMERCGLSLPVVLKPDVGERGRDVVIARSREEMESYLRQARRDTILQQYIDGPEFGLFYCRYPGQPAGRILSITEKHLPAVVGDGCRTIDELILRDRRAACLASTYLSRLRRSAADVPAAGEIVPLAEIGSHCRGAVFLDGKRLNTAALEAAVDRLAKAHPGFFFGRFDVRARSAAELQEGCFQVIELNGVTGEATHIYDPAVRLLEAYRVLFRHWRMAFEIGAINRRLGAQPMAVRELIGLVRAA